MKNLKTKTILTIKPKWNSQIQKTDWQSPGTRGGSEKNR